MNYFLIGHPLSHSFSADYFNRKFEDNGIDSHYDLCEIKEISELPNLLRTYGDSLTGFNITAPFKKEIMSFVDILTPEAIKSEAVNCVRKEADGTLTGHNTDIEGFIKLLENNSPWSLEGRKALIIGGGGVVGAVIAALEIKKIGVIVTVRNPEHFRNNYPDRNIKVIKMDSLTKEDILDSDIIVNCTPLGTYPEINNAPPIPYEYIQKRHLCLDLVYNPKETVFTKICSAHGASCASGMDMLIGQAEAGWKFWNKQ